MCKSNTNDFVKKSKEIHNNKYDYSLVEYKNAITKVTIICPLHGKFLKSPSGHLKGQGCPCCIYDSKKSNTKEFIYKANKVHNNFYDYSLSDYVKSDIKIKIICPIHGEFTKTPNNHLRGQGCKLCSNENKKTSKVKFIEKSNIIHKKKYDYSNVEFNSQNDKVKIICPFHGEFSQKVKNHLSGRGCQKCSIDKSKYNTQDFIDKANDIHNNKYDYSKVEYVNNATKVTIVCPFHGDFLQNPSNHLSGKGCKKCAIKKVTDQQKKSNAQFIKECKNIHGDKYDYSITNYISCRQNVDIICPVHGIFNMRPLRHSNGSNCPKCVNEQTKSKNETHLYELIKKDYPDLEILSNDREILQGMELDIVINNINLAIEWNGVYWHNKDEKSKEKDIQKKKLLGENLIQIVDYGGEDIGFVSLKYETIIKPEIQKRLDKRNNIL